jgi:hypothetical protein
VAARRQTSAGNHLARNLIYDSCTSLDCQGAAASPRTLPEGLRTFENYGVIGNMRSIALAGMNGSIDFLCYPDFDSPTVFAALL